MTTLFPRMAVTRRTLGLSLGAVGALGLVGGLASRNLGVPFRLGGGRAPVLGQRETIDRRSLVRRHNPTLKKINPVAPLSVGNGEFAVTVDVTGLQSMPDAYEVPLNILSQWGWHSARPHHDLPQDFRFTSLRSQDGREVPYPLDPEGQQVMYAWRRANPHRLHLGNISFYLMNDGRALQADEVRDPEQTLDLWTGIITSRFRLGGTPVVVETCCHPERDVLAVSVESALLERGELGVRFLFPHPDTRPEDKVPSPQRTDDLLEFQSKVSPSNANSAVIQRAVDSDRYVVSLTWSQGGALEQRGPHTFVLRPGAGKRLELICSFSPEVPAEALPWFSHTRRAGEQHWGRFWTEGGAIDLDGSTDPRARELERRIVLSQYLTAINCAGSLPPAETGLFSLSWHGKFHLEMHWWHAAHFALWNRIGLMERSLGWYERILPAAKDLARSQGYAGARWPKMVGPEGRQSPSSIAPLLIWQQPHPIAFAELMYMARPERATLGRFADVVFQTAEFMASFAAWDKAGQRYVLGPPLIPAQEVFGPEETLNPTYELAYWRYGLAVAQRWRERLGLPLVEEWERVRSTLAPLPVKEGLYLAHERGLQTYTERNRDHPSMLAALGVLPGQEVDRETMRRTLRKVMADWRWDKVWGWDFPMAAMTAARLGEPDLAVDVLMMDSPRNQYLVNGHNRQGRGLPVYLPGNGGLLAAVAMMAAGWQGSPAASGVAAPGFPANGRWRVRWADLHAWL